MDAYAKHVAAGTEKWPGVAPAAAGPGEQHEPPKSFKEARKMAQALIKGRAGEVTT